MGTPRGSGTFIKKPTEQVYISSTKHNIFHQVLRSIKYIYKLTVVCGGKIRVNGFNKLFRLIKFATQ